MHSKRSRRRVSMRNDEKSTDCARALMSISYSLKLEREPMVLCTRGEIEKRVRLWH